MTETIGVDADLPRIDQPTRPALEKLWQDQMDVVRSFVAGFEDRPDVLRWCQEAIIATLGELPDDWFPDRLLSEPELALLVVDDDVRDRLVDDPPSLAKARAYREALVSDDLIPACREATVQFRWSAVERTPDDDDEESQQALIDLENQTTPAMRPAFAELEERQTWVIDRAVDGFADMDALTTWLMVVVRATYGEVDDDLAGDFWREQHLREMFVTAPTDHPHGPQFRVTLVARDLLPAMNRATAKLASHAGEAVEMPETTDQSPMEYK